MKYCNLLFCALFSFCCFGVTDTVSDFEFLKSDIIDELTAVNNNYAAVITRMNQTYENGLAEYQYITDMAANHPNSDVYSGMVSGAQSMMGYFQEFASIRNDMMTFTRSINNAISNISSLTAPTNSNVDLQPVIDAIHSNTYQIVTAVNVGVHDITNSIALNIATLVGRADVAISHLQSIRDILQGFDFSAGSSGGSTDVSGIEDSLFDIVDILNDILTTENNIALDVGSIASFVQWCLDPNNPFRKFLDLAHSRLDSPDVSLSADLAQMWAYCLEQISNIVFKADGYPLHTQINPVVSDSSVHLSNEGLIGLENLAMNQRQYLCSVAMLNELKGLNSTNNLSWITNYLGTVQRTFYEYFNLTDIPKSRGTSYYFQNHLSLYTNFLGRVYSHKPVGSSWWDYYSDRTNLFERIEIQLMTLNGLFPLSHVGLDEFEDSTSDEENNDRLIRYSTNNLVAVSESFAGVSNTVSFVLNEYRSAINSIWPDNLGSTTEITILPSIDFGGIQIDHIHLTYGSIETVGDSIRLVCQAVYWFFGLFLAFRFWRGILRVLGSVVVSLQKLLGLVLT